jgi:hypothetical protein
VFCASGEYSVNGRDQEGVERNLQIELCFVCKENSHLKEDNRQGASL